MDNIHREPQHGQTIDRAFLLEQLHHPGTILLESSRNDAQNRHNLFFYRPAEILSTRSLDDIPSFFKKIETYLSQGKFIAGYFAYECGYHFESILPSVQYSDSSPLVWLGIYDAPLLLSADVLRVQDYETTEISAGTLTISDKIYKDKIESIKKYILEGDTYQVNFTDRIEFTFRGDPVDLYWSLRAKQHVPYSAYIKTDSADILSFSPELFFHRKGDTIRTKPMKGTGKRGATTGEDRLLSDWLRNDEKNRSENLMIVDLLRNDLGRVCLPGSVAVTDMFAVEQYETVMQMTSTVSGKLLSNIGYYDIFHSLFPCGSVTGAPKIRTMQIISELENKHRGIYCGAIGYISPDSEAVFNVGIRTISINDDHGWMGVGSGIVYDSDPSRELEECLVKGRFLTDPPARFDLIETMLWDNGFAFMEQHIDRLRDSAEYFFFLWNESAIRAALIRIESIFEPSKQYRVRLLLSQAGDVSIEYREFNEHDGRQAVIKIADEKTDSTDRFYFHKTTHRPLYSKYASLAASENIKEYIFFNERGEVTEGTISNIFIEKGNRLFTPPSSAGLLNGVYRSHVLTTSGTAEERTLHLDDLQNADSIFICNSVRGMQKVSLLL